MGVFGWCAGSTIFVQDISNNRLLSMVVGPTSTLLLKQLTLFVVKTY